MMHALPYVLTMRELTPLLRQTEAFCVTRFAEVCDWGAFYWNRGTISYRIDEHGAQGICTIKTFKYLEQFLEPFVHEPCGRFVMIDTLVSTSAKISGEMWDELVGRWGPHQVVIWDRQSRTQEGAPRMHKWDDFAKLTRMFTKGHARLAARKER